MKKNVAFLALLLFVATAFFTVGCGSDKPKTYLVTGTITVAGEPVETGTITLKPADGQGMDFGGKIENGNFSFECSDGEKIVQARGAKVVGEVVPDPLYPDRKVPKVEDYPAKTFTEEVKVTVEKKKNQTIEIKFSGEGAPK